MKQKNTEMINTLFIGDCIKQMTELTVHLGNNKFDVCLKKAESSNPELCKKTYYKIFVSADQHDAAFNEGVYYCSERNFDKIVCGYSNGDFDTVENIKERNNSFNR